MKRRILTVLLTLCMVLCIVPTVVFPSSAAIVHQSAKAEYEKLVNSGVLPRDIPFTDFVDVGVRQNEGSDDIVIGNNGVYFITGSVTFSGKNPARIRVDDKVTGAVAYFYNCYMDYTQCGRNYAPVTVHEGGSANFHFIGSNTFIGSSKRAGIEKNYKSGGGRMTLWLWDDCTLTATGGEYAAGIGSSYEKSGGNIVIEAHGSKGNGKLKATGTKGGPDDIGGAGIGGSSGGNAYNITITGGDIEARGGANAAGIGGGYCGGAENIHISGGKVKATAGASAAGIGTGSCSEQRAKKRDWLVCKDVYITGGDVTAQGSFSRTAAIGGGIGGKAENIKITGGNVTVAVSAIVFGRVIGGGQDCTEGEDGNGNEDISKNLEASLSSVLNIGQYYEVTFVTEPGGKGKYKDVVYRIYPGETFDIKKAIHDWYVIKPEGSSHGTFVPGIRFRLVDCTHTRTVSEDGVTYLVTTDYYESVGEDRVHKCDQCGSVLDYDNTFPTLDKEYSKSIVDDWTFRVIDPEPTNSETKKFSYTNPNGNTVDFFVPERPSGIYEVLLDGKPLTANADGSYTVPADSSLPNNRIKHTLSYSDWSGKSLTHEGITVYEAITLSAFCDGEPMLINDTGNFEIKMGKGWKFTLTGINTPGYNGYYKIFVNGEYFGTCLQTADFERFYVDTRLDFYTERDTELPTGTISVSTNSWTGFDAGDRRNSQVFVNKNEKVSVTARDEQSGVGTVQYLVSSEALDEARLKNETNWSDYSEPFGLPTDKAYYVYVKVTDKTGNVAYINSAAIRAINEPVGITSVSGNPTEWQATPAEIVLSVTGDAEIASATVYVDGSTVGDACTVVGNQVKFSAKKNGSYRVVVTDLAGNTAEETVEVSKIDASVPTVTVIADEDIARRSATVIINVADSLSGYKLYLSRNGEPERELTERALTVTENGSYTVRAVNGVGTEHSATFVYTKLDRQIPLLDGIGDGKIYCESATFRVTDESAVTVTVDGEALLPDGEGVYTVTPANEPRTVTVSDAAGNEVTVNITVNAAHIWSDWTHLDNTHARHCTVDGCTATETENCFGGTATCTDKAKCDICGEEYGEPDLTNHTGTTEWIRTETKHTQKYNCCDTVTVSEEDHSWENGVCSECGYPCAHGGGTATCTKKAICDICGEEYGETDANNHSDLMHFDAKEPTSDEEGNVEYWYCSSCGKYFSDADATNEIGKADIVREKLPEEEHPNTGDKNDTVLWCALLAVAVFGAAVVLTTFLGKRKRGED